MKNFNDFRDRYLVDNGHPALRAGDQSFRYQAGDRLANRRPRNAEPVGEGLFLKPRPGGQLAADDHPAQPVMSGVAKRLAVF